MKSTITREKAWELLREYNQESFHLQHGLTVEAVMRWFAVDQGFGEDEEFWGITGLLHDVDFERYPQEHCVKAAQILQDHGVSEEMIRAICSHGYGIMVEIQPEHQMEKILYATDELTGLIGACALMRPSNSVSDMELKSLKKKFKDKRFAAGCSREVILNGAQMLGWDLDTLLGKTLEAMKASEEKVRGEMEERCAQC